MRLLCVLIVLLLLFAMPQSANATSFNLILDPSTEGAPAGFLTAFNDARQFYEANFSDSVVINLRVGWGEIDDGPLNPGNLGQSRTNQQAFPYSVVKAALLRDAKTSDDALAAAHLPGTDPTPGRNFVMSNAEAKALGLLAANASELDGWVGFNSTATYTFDPNSRAVPGAFDFIGVAEHEITEVMGRYGFGQNGSGMRDSPIDLFRYFEPGVPDFAPAFGGAANYFSIDGGATMINTFNINCCGDLSDWSGLTFDAYNASLTRGQAMLTSSGDLKVMDVLGYDRVAGPTTVSLVAAGVALLRVVDRRRRRSK
jgi:hypothetical protein